MAETRIIPTATVVTAGDRAFAWGALTLVAGMRRNGTSSGESRLATAFRRTSRRCARRKLAEMF